MANETNEALKLVLCIEEHMDVLTKSQVQEQKQKKNDAADKIIEKWKDLTGNTLTQARLLKKINNIKSRAKTALSNGKPLNEWQSKILAIAGAELESEHKHNKCIIISPSVSVASTSHDPPKNGSPDGASNGLLNAEQILNKYESDETRSLTTEQLKRLIFLKQIKLINCQQQLLDRPDGNKETLRDVVFDFVGFETENMS